MKATILKIATSLIIFALLLLHQFHPAITIDAMSLSLIVLVALPWLLTYVKGFEIGDVKIELHDVKSATEKVDLNVDASTPKLSFEPLKATVEPTSVEGELAILGAISKTHPNLALVHFRLQVELRIRAMAKSRKLLNERVPLSRTIRALVSSDVIDSRTGSGLLEIVALGNQAAHNADVSEEAASWVLDAGPSILLQLDAAINVDHNGD